MSDHSGEIYDLQCRIDELEKELTKLKELIPDNLKKKLKELETKAGDLEDAIDELQ